MHEILIWDSAKWPLYTGCRLKKEVLDKTGFTIIYLLIFPQEEEEKEKSRLDEEKRKQEAELAEFERKTKGRKRKQRKETTVDTKESFLSKHRKLLALSVVIPILAVFAYYLISQWCNQMQSALSSCLFLCLFNVSSKNIFSYMRDGT